MTRRRFALRLLSLVALAYTPPARAVESCPLFRDAQSGCSSSDPNVAMDCTFAWISGLYPGSTKCGGLQGLACDGPRTTCFYNQQWRMAGDPPCGVPTGCIALAYPASPMCLYARSMSVISTGCISVQCVVNADCNDGKLCTVDRCLVPPGTDAGAVCTHTSDSALCDDGDFCNGVEQCISGLCVPPATRINCNDNKACTTDYCNSSANQCVNTPNPLMCRCNPGFNPEIESTVGVTLPSSVADLPCPGSEEVQGVSATATATFKGRSATCDNACTASLSGELSLNTVVKMCGKGTTQGGTGKFTRTEKRCEACNGTTCQMGCTAGGCRTNSASGTLNSSAELYRTFKKSALRSLVVKCSLKGSAGAKVAVTYDGTSPLASAGGACPTCVDCDSVSTTATVNGSASGGCEIGPPSPPMGQPRRSVSIVAKASAELTIGGSSTITGQGGACTNQTCYGASATGTVAVNGSGTLKILFWEGSVKCSGGYSGCTEANSCGACACGSGSCSEVKRDDFSCKVIESAVVPGP